MGTVKKDVLLISYIISIAQVTSRGGIASPGHSFKLLGVGTKSEACQAANNDSKKINEHVSRKSVWRMCDQGPQKEKEVICTSVLRETISHPQR